MREPIVQAPTLAELHRIAAALQTSFVAILSEEIERRLHANECIQIRDHCEVMAREPDGAFVVNATVFFTDGSTFGVQTPAVACDIPEPKLEFEPMH